MSRKHSRGLKKTWGKETFFPSLVRPGSQTLDNSTAGYCSDLSVESPRKPKKKKHGPWWAQCNPPPPPCQRPSTCQNPLNMRRGNQFGPSWTTTMGRSRGQQGWLVSQLEGVLKPNVLSLHPQGRDDFGRIFRCQDKLDVALVQYDLLFSTNQARPLWRVHPKFNIALSHAGLSITRSTSHRDGSFQTSTFPLSNHSSCGM